MSLCVLMDSNGFLCVLINAYSVLWILMYRYVRPYGSSLHLIVPFTFDSNVSLWVLICPYLSLWVFNGSLWVRKSFYALL